MLAAAADHRSIPLAAFSRRWWALWFRSVERGHSVDAMVRAALSGQSWRIAKDQVPSAIGMVDINVNSRAFGDWAVHFQRRGVRLPRPSRAPVIFVPSVEPPTLKEREENP